MKKLVVVSLSIGLFALALTGCSDKSSFEQMSKADQQKVWQGNPEVGKAMSAKMMAKYAHSGPPPGAVPGGAQQPAGNTGKQ